MVLTNIHIIDNIVGYNKNMKIAFIGQKGIPAQTGGVEKQVEELLVHLAARGHSVYAYNRRGYAPEMKEFKGVKLISLPFIKGKNLEAISHVFLSIVHLAFHKFDIIHFQSIGPASLLWLVKIVKPRTPIVFTFHCQDYYHKKWSLFARLYLKFGEKIGCILADQTLVTSKELTSYALNRYNKGARYIASGINEPSLLAPDKIKEKWNLDKDSYILLASRLVRHKGIHYFIEAFKKIKTNKKLVIAGGSAHTDDYVNELHDLARDDDRIIFTGNQIGHNLQELYSNAYIFGQPSEYEGLSMALLEAMSYALPCLVSDIPSNKEALNGFGYTFKNQDIEDLYNKLSDLLLMDSKDLKTMGQALKEKTRKEYNWDLIVDETIGLYNQLFKKNK